MSNVRQLPSAKLAEAARTAIEACSGWNSRLAARRIARFLERRMEGHRLSLTQFILLAQIAAAGEDTVGGLSARMDLDQSTLSRNLRALEAEGLATIAGVEGDLRIRAVHLTAEGAARLRAALPAWRRAHDELAVRLDPDLAPALARATASLEDR